MNWAFIETNAQFIIIRGEKIRFTHLFINLSFALLFAVRVKKMLALVAVASVTYLILVW